MAKIKVLMVDPPSGWKYGFPQPVPNPLPENMTDWLVEHGYPLNEITRMREYFYVRYFESEIDDGEPEVEEESSLQTPSDTVE